MTLSRNLDDVMLTMLCHGCAQPCIRKGSWFKHVARFKCAQCGYATQLTYDNKQRLFDKHALR
jgi:transposase-like protein